MSKRDLAGLAGTAVDIDGPRSKRRKGAAPASSPDPPEEARTAKVEAANDDDNGDGGDENVQEQGLLLWQTIKNAVNKEARVLSVDFMRLPSKRQYADYYQLIKRPVSLDMVKSQLDGGQYATLNAVKQDLEQCFVNAKKYNIRDSQIWKDAKSLHKLVKKEYAKITGEPEDDQADGGEVNGEIGGSDDEGKKKKSPSLTRLLKTRLQKLVEKTDDTGRVLSTEFMELPSKKMWPMYYKQIARPMCFEDIFKNLKRKKYQLTSEFAKDVETVFDNAVTFNADHTIIWEDAQKLRSQFAHLMADLPPQFSLPQYTTSQPAKIKIKMPKAASPPAAPSASRPSAPGAPVQGKPPAAIAPAPAPSAAKTTAVSSSTPSLPYMPVQARPSATPAAKPPAPAPAAAPSTSYTPSYYTKPAAYTPAPIARAASSSTTPVIAPQALPSTSTSGSPAPSATPTHTQRPLRYVTLATVPAGRCVDLDVRDGVRSWMLRLGRAERALRVSGVRFLGAGVDDDGRSDAEGEDGAGGEANEEMIDVDVDGEEADDVPRAKGKGKGRKGKRGRKVVKEKVREVNGVKLPPRKKEEVLVRLNGVVVPEAPDADGGEWLVEPAMGMSSVLEVGSKGGIMWKVYVQRSSA